MTAGRLFLIPVGFGMLFLAARAADWPQWRGPLRSGISQESGLLKEWPKDGPKLLWQLDDIGDGYATPAVVGTRLYLLSNRGLDNEFVQTLAVLDAPITQGGRGVEVGVLTCSYWPACARPVLFVNGVDSFLVANARLHPEIPISPGDYIGLFIDHTDGGWRVSVQAGGTRTLLETDRLPFNRAPIARGANELSSEKQ